MKDIILSEIYNDVRGADWPDIDGSLYDYYYLPSHIKKELEEDFRIFENIESNDYWSDFITPAMTPTDYKKNKFCYIPITKCASTHYITLFSELDWKPQDFAYTIDTKNTYFFAFVMHPLKRYLKGLTHTVWMYNFQHHERYDELINDILIPDGHTIPYTQYISSDVLNNLFCIPMDFLDDDQGRVYLMEYLKNCGYEINLPTMPRRNVSPPEKLEVYNDLVNRLQYNKNVLHKIYRLGYAEDLRLYRKSVENYQHYKQTGEFSPVCLYNTPLGN